MEHKQGVGFWLVMTLALLAAPIWKFSTGFNNMPQVCFTVIDLRFEPLPPGGSSDLLILMQGRLWRRDVIICPNEPNFNQKTLEAEWNRISMLRVVLNSPPGEVFTATPATDRPSGLYAIAIRNARSVVRQRIQKELVVIEAGIIAIAALFFCAGHWFTGGARRSDDAQKEQPLMGSSLTGKEDDRIGGG